MPAGIDYVVPGPLTVLSGIDPAVLAGLPDDPVGICWLGCWDESRPGRSWTVSDEQVEPAEVR